MKSVWCSKHSVRFSCHGVSAGSPESPQKDTDGRRTHAPLKRKEAEPVHIPHQFSENGNSGIIAAGIKCGDSRYRILRHGKGMRDKMIYPWLIG